MKIKICVVKKKKKTEEKKEEEEHPRKGEGKLPIHRPELGSSPEVL